jgi:hypothetical protein
MGAAAGGPTFAGFGAFSGMANAASFVSLNSAILTFCLVYLPRCIACLQSGMDLCI